jgi:predicted small secreted protein
MPYRRVYTGFIAVLAAVVLAGCDNPVSGGGHLVPDGVVIRQAGEVVASHVGATVTGELTVAVGQQSAPLTVHFVRDGADVVPPQGYYLEVPARPAVEWQPDAAGGFAGRLVGKTAGTTGLTFRWMHGAVGRGHQDFAREIPVIVTP